MKEISEEYRTGIEAIDEEHAVLLDLTDKVDKLFKDEFMLFKCADIRKLIAALYEYTVKHFAHEEEYMAEIGYEGLEQQKVQHREFQKKLMEFNDRVSQLSLDTQDGMIAELFDYLQNWLQCHIKQEDMKYVGK